jgi:preprotein translocase subunit SecB
MGCRRTPGKRHPRHHGEVRHHCPGAAIATAGPTMVANRAAAREKIMAQDTTGNGPAAPQPAPAAATQPQQQLIINAQYIKDLSFENPNAPSSLRQLNTPPAVEINVDVKAQGLGQDNYEVVLTINASAKIQNDTLFLVELSYGGLVTVRNVPQELLTSVVLVETPRLLFPFARNIIAETTRDGGFPPLLINPIDFNEVVRRNAAGGQTAPAPPPA